MITEKYAYLPTKVYCCDTGSEIWIWLRNYYIEIDEGIKRKVIFNRWRK